MTLLACVQLALLLLASCLRAEEHAADCPFSCAKADEWCTAKFGAGGALRAADCIPGKAFQCTCNDHAASVLVTVNQLSGQCEWNTTFQDSPSGETCRPSTGHCPTVADCAGNTSFFEDQCRNGAMACNPSPVNSSLPFTMACFTCSAGLYTIDVPLDASCAYAYTPPVVPCVPATRCSGHGCCRSPMEAEFVASQCVCFADSVHGYWADAYCSGCDKDHTLDSGCREARSNIFVLLASIGGSPSVMVLPNLMVVVIFVLFGLVRRRWDSDAVSTMAIRREAGLTPLPRPCLPPQPHGQLFLPRVVAKRPAASRGFVAQMQRHQDGLGFAR